VATYSMFGLGDGSSEVSDESTTNGSMTARVVVAAVIGPSTGTMTTTIVGIGTERSDEQKAKAAAKADREARESADDADSGAATTALSNLDLSTALAPITAEDVMFTPSFSIPPITELVDASVNTTFITLELLSGSTDTLRTAIGTSYEIVETEDSSNTTLESTSFTAWNGNTLIGDYASAVELQEKITGETVMPNAKFPVRLIGNADQIKDDKFWKTVLMGGEFGEDSYDALYNELTFKDYNFLYSQPYGITDVLEMPNAATFNTLQITYNYNYYLPEYQQANAAGSDLLIPNMYLIQMFNGVDLETTSFDNDIYNLVSLEDTIDPTELLNSVTSQNPVAPPPAGSAFVTAEAAAAIIGYSATLEDPVLNLHTYLSSSWVNTPLSASTTTAIENRLQNLMFDEDGIVNTYENMKANSYKFPYYVTIDFPISTKDTTDFLFGGSNTSMVDSIQNNAFSTKFLKTLKEIFKSEISSIQPTTVSMVRATEYLSGSSETLVQSVDTSEYQIINFMDLLAYAYNNYNSNTTNCYFIGELTTSTTTVMENTGIGRYQNTISSLGVLNDMMSYLDTYFNLGSLKDLYDLSQRYSETLAYRVDKIGGAVTGDSSTQNILQSYWVFNSDTIEDLKIYDSQIKYGEDYTYQCYAYQLVIGYRYKFSDIVISRNIGTDPSDQLAAAISSGKGNVTDLVAAFNAGELSCLEFFDPTTGEISNALTAEATDQEGFGRSLDIGEFNEFVSAAQELGTYKYLADFYLNYEPCIKLIEMPIAISITSGDAT